MPDSLARLIVDEALAIRRARPELSAIQVLDLTMRGRRGTVLRFGALGEPACLVEPSGDFGLLLAAAFDEQVTFSGLRSLDPRAGAPNAFELFWVERVLRAFAARYGVRLAG